jgi:hypothetical protein
MIQSLNRWSDVRNVERNVMRTVNDLALRISWRFRDPVLQEDEEEEEKEEEENYIPGNNDKTKTEPARVEEAPSSQRQSPSFSEDCAVSAYTLA